MLLTKQEMIDSIKTAGVSDDYVARLEAMSERDVELEYLEFGRSMKD